VEERPVIARGRKSAEQRLVLLVGSNPLPNYLRVWVDPPREVVLVASAVSLPLAHRLAMIIENEFDTTSTVIIELDDPVSFSSCKNALASIGPGAALDYTGGTKVMAVAAREALAPPSSRASYVEDLSEPDSIGRVRFDDGRSVNIPPTAVDLNRMFRIHGISARKESTPALLRFDDLLIEPFTIDPSDATAFHHHLRSSDEQDLALRVRGFAAGRAGSANAALVAAAERVELVSLNAKQLKKTQKELESGWFESWVSSVISGLAPAAELRTGANLCRESGREFEVDMLVGRGHRLHLVSVTISGEPGEVKRKAFEAGFRAQQVGGVLARSSVVSLLDAKALALVRADVEGVWDAVNVPRIFGAGDVKRWHRGDTTSLGKWLEVA